MADNEVKLIITADAAGAVTGLRTVSDSFSKMSTSASNAISSVSSLKNTIITLASSFGAFKMIDLAKDATLLAARYETLGVSMRVVGANAGYSSSELQKYQDKLESTGIAMAEARQTIMQMASAHIDLAKSAELARIAQDAAVIGNINSSEAFQRMIYGIQSGQVEVLKTIGINVSFEESYKKLALQFGKNTASLSEKEKIQARVNAVMEKGADIAGTYEAAMGTAGKQLNSLKRYIDNTKITLGGLFNEALLISVQIFTDGLKDLNKESNNLAQNQKLKEWGRSLIMDIAFIADGLQGLVVIWKLLTQTVIWSADMIWAWGNVANSALRFDTTGVKRWIEYAQAGTKAYGDIVSKTVTNIKSAQVEAKKWFALKDSETVKEFTNKKSDNKDSDKDLRANAEAVKRLNDEWQRLSATMSQDIYIEGLDEMSSELTKLGFKVQDLMDKFKGIPQAQADIQQWFNSQENAIRNKAAEKEAQEQVKIGQAQADAYAEYQKRMTAEQGSEVSRRIEQAEKEGQELYNLLIAAGVDYEERQKLKVDIDAATAQKRLQIERDYNKQIADIEKTRLLALIDLAEKAREITAVEANDRRLRYYQSQIESLENQYKELAGIKDKELERLTLLGKITEAESKIVELKEEQKKLTGTFEEGAAEGLNQYIDSLDRHFERGKQIALDFARTLEDSLVQIFDRPMQAIKNLGDFFITTLKRMIAQAIAQPIVLQVGAMMGLSGTANAAMSAGSMLSNTGLFGSGSSLFGIPNAVNSLFGYSGGSMYGGMVGMGYSAPIGPTLTGAPMGGNLAYGATPFGYIAAPLAGFGLGSMMSNMMGRTGMAGGIGGALGSLGGYALGSSAAVSSALGLGALGGPIGILIGGLLGGALGSLFGGKKEWKDPWAVFHYQPQGSMSTYHPGKDWQGQAAEATGGGISEFAWKNFDGGQIAGQMTQLFNTFRDQLKTGFEALKMDTSKFGNDWEMSIDLAGKSQEEAMQAIKGMLGEYAKSVMPDGVDFTQFQKSGETLADTVLRIVDAITQIPKLQDNINDYIAAINNSYDALAKWKEQLATADENINKLKTSLNTATDPSDAVNYANQLKQAIYDKYTAEKQMIEGLVQSIDQLELDANKLKFDLQGKIDQLTGSANSAGIALAKMGYAMERVQYYQGQNNYQSSISWLNEYIGGVDSWVSAQTAAIQSRYAELEKTAQDALKAQQDELKASQDSVNKQLDVIKGWSSLLDSVKKTLTDLKTGQSNPADVFERLAISKSELDNIMALYQGSSGEDRLKYAQQASEAQQNYLKIAQEAYQRPSPEYQGIYDSVIGGLEGIQADAGGYASTAESLTAELNRLTEVSNNLSQQNVDYSSQMKAELDALNQEAAKYYEWAQTTGSQIYTDAIAEMRERLAGILGDKTVEQYLSDLQLAAVTELVQIRDLLSKIRDDFVAQYLTNDKDTSVPESGSDVNKYHHPIFGWVDEYGEPIADGSHAGGLDYVPFDGYRAILHKGERVQTAGEARKQDSGGGDVNITVSPQISITANGNSDARAIAREVESIVIDSIRNGKAKREIKELVKYVR